MAFHSMAPAFLVSRIEIKRAVEARLDALSTANCRKLPRAEANRRSAIGNSPPKAVDKRNVGFWPGALVPGLSPVKSLDT